MNKKNSVTKVIAAAVIGVVVGGLGVGAIALSNPVIEVKEVPVTTEVIKEVPVEKLVEVIKEVEVPVEVVKEVTVDNGNLAKVMDYVEENVDEDLTVDYMVFEIDSINLAESYIKDNMVELLDDNDFFDDGEALEDYRESEVSIRSISEPVVSERDFDDKDMVLDYEVKVKAREDSETASYVYFNVTIPFENGKMIVDEIEVVEK